MSWRPPVLTPLASTPRFVLSKRASHLPSPRPLFPLSSFLSASAANADCNLDTFDFQSTLAELGQCVSSQQGALDVIEAACTNPDSITCAALLANAPSTVCPVLTAMVKCALKVAPCWDDTMRDEAKNIVDVFTTLNCTIPTRTFTYDIVFPNKPADFKTLTATQLQTLCANVLNNMGYEDSSSRCTREPATVRVLRSPAELCFRSPGSCPNSSSLHLL